MARESSHDVMRSYLIQRAGSHLPALHARLLDACWQAYGLTRWADLPQSEAYLWQRLVYHLCQAGNQEALQTTLTDLRWLTRKALYVGASALEADLLLASTVPSTGRIAELAPSLLASLHRRIVRISHLLQQAQTSAEVGGLLLGYLGWEQPFAIQWSSLEQELPRPFLTTWHPLPPSSVALIRTLSGHTGMVFGCAVSPDSHYIVSASSDRTLKVWDAATGKERFSLAGHTDSARL